MSNAVVGDKVEYDKESDIENRKQTQKINNHMTVASGFTEEHRGASANQITDFGQGYMPGAPVYTTSFENKHKPCFLLLFSSRWSDGGFEF